MVFFVPNPKKELFAWIYYLKWQKEIGPVIRFVPLYREPDAYIIFSDLSAKCWCDKRWLFPSKKIKSLPYNSFFKSSMSGRALRSRSGISLDAR